MKNNIPIYQIIENDLRKAISEGKYKPGDLIPSETDLSSTYHVTRMTVRQAMNNLLIDGWVYRHKGLGTFVSLSRTEMEKPSHYFNFPNEPYGIEGQMITTVINFEEHFADDNIAGKLQIKCGDPLYYVERIKSIDDIVLVYERIYLPGYMFIDLSEDLFSENFYRYMEEGLGLKIHKYHMSIEARLMNHKVAGYLQKKDGDPTLYTNCISYLNDGRAFEFRRCYLNAQYYRYKYTHIH